MRRGALARSGRCGSALAYQHAQRADELDLATATLAEPARLAPQAHLWAEDAPAWEATAHALPRFARWRTRR